MKKEERKKYVLHLNNHLEKLVNYYHCFQTKKNYDICFNGLEKMKEDSNLNNLTDDELSRLVDSFNIAATKGRSGMGKYSLEKLVSENIEEIKSLNQMQLNMYFMKRGLGMTITQFNMRQEILNKYIK